MRAKVPFHTLLRSFCALLPRCCGAARGANAGGFRRRAGSSRRESARGRLHPELVESTLALNSQLYFYSSREPNACEYLLQYFRVK